MDFVSAYYPKQIGIDLPIFLTLIHSPVVAVQKIFESSGLDNFCNRFIRLQVGRGGGKKETYSITT
jgi:hypothetical protein